MKKNWIRVVPADRPTSIMLEFILDCCHQIRQKAEDYRFPISDEKQRIVVKEFVQNRPEAAAVPRYTLAAATRWPSRHVDGFLVPARNGWSEIPGDENDGITWEEYNRGEVANRKIDLRISDSKQVYDMLLLDKKLRFQWGTLVLQGSFVSKLDEQAGGNAGLFLGHVRWVEFRVVNTRSDVRKWKMYFELEYP